MAPSLPSSARNAEHVWQSATSAYSETPQPLGAYLTLMGVFGAVVTGLAGAMWFTKTKLPEKPRISEMFLLGVAAHKLARIVTLGRVTSPIRFPFVRYIKGAGEGEVEEEPRGHGMQEAVGDLLTCPYCIGMWIITPMWFGMALAPRLTRFVVGVLVSLTTSDFMHRVYLKAKKWGDR